MKTLLASTILSAALAFPAFAQTDTTCADFVAMDESGQMEAMAAMGSDMMASDDMASDDMASDDMASDDMASDDMADGAMPTADVAEACAANPDMTVEDAMTQAMGN